MVINDGRLELSTARKRSSFSKSNLPQQAWNLLPDKSFLHPRTTSLQSQTRIIFQVEEKETLNRTNALLVKPNVRSIWKWNAPNNKKN